MARVVFTTNLRRHVDCPEVEAEGATVRDIMQRVFETNDRLRAYILDDQGGLRKHMTILVDGVRIRDRETLSDQVKPASEVYVLQSLSGG